MVQKILTFITISLLIYTVYSILKWCVQKSIKNRRIFKILSHYNTPPHIPLLGHALNFIGTPTKIHNRLVDFCFTYGPNFVIWLLDRVILMVGKPEDLEKVLTSQNCLEKSEMYEMIEMVGGTGLISAPVKKWRRTRKVINPTFNTRVLEGYIPIFGSCTATFIDEILPKHLGNKEVDWYSIFFMLNADILLLSSMGVNHDVQRKPYEILESFEVCMKAIFLRMAQVIYRPDFIFYRTDFGKLFLKKREKLWNHLEKIIQDRKQKFRKDLDNNKCQSFLDEDTKAPLTKKSFLDCLLELDYRGMNFTDQDLKDEVTTFFMAGTDTTTTTECFFLTMMGMHPDIQEKVHEEARYVFGTDSIPNMQEINKLEYLDRCLKESLRLFPSAPVFFRTNTGDDLTISDGVIPKGASIGICLPFVHRSELYWNDPLKYNPDRFLPDEMAKRHPYTFIPFSGGSRVCIGQRYSYNVMKTTMGLLLSKYRVHCDAYKNVEEIAVKSTVVLKPVNGFKFWIEERKSI